MSKIMAACKALFARLKSYFSQILPQTEVEANALATKVVQLAGYDETDKQNLLMVLSELMQYVHKHEGEHAVKARTLVVAFLRAKANNAVFRILDAERAIRTKAAIDAAEGKAKQASSSEQVLANPGISSPK